MGDAASADAGYWRARAGQAEARLAAVERENAALAGQVATLSGQVATLSGLLFGTSSEKQSRSQAGGDDAEAEGGSRGEAGVGPGRGSARRGQRQGAAGHSRRDYAHLETETRIIDLDGDQRCCEGCGKAFISSGFEDSEQLDWQIKVVRIIWRRLRYQRSCRCAGPATVCAPPAPKVIAKGLYTADFLSRVLYFKYVLGLPVHRIISMLEAEGASVAAGGVTGALKELGVLIRPLGSALAARLEDTGHVHADETRWQVYEHCEGKDGNRWWLWTFLSDEVSVFVIAPTRGIPAAATALGIDVTADALPDGRRLLISSDFYSVYQSLSGIEGVDALYCWAHIRRYFIRARDAHPEALAVWAQDWIGRIARLYRTHHALPATEPGTGEHEQALARFQLLFDDLDSLRIAQSEPAEPLHPAAAKVIATLNREWSGLARHRDLPFLPLDDNAAERAIRGPVIGRENFHGSGAVWAATLAADVWTVTATAARHDQQPLALLTDYLKACADNDGKAPKDLDPFLPWTPTGRRRRTTTEPAPAPAPDP